MVGGNRVNQQEDAQTGLGGHHTEPWSRPNRLLSTFAWTPYK